jgi:hypothetical protein
VQRADLDRLPVVSAVAAAAAGIALSQTNGLGFGSAPAAAGAVLAICAIVGALVLAGAPYWYRRRAERRRWWSDGAVVVYVGLIVVAGWLLFAWDGNGLLGLSPDDEPAWLLALVPYAVLGYVWRGRALFPALVALLVCGGLDEMVNGELCVPSDELCGGPAADAYIAALIATPSILLGAAASHLLGIGATTLRR